LKIALENEPNTRLADKVITHHKKTGSQ